MNLKIACYYFCYFFVLIKGFGFGIQRMTNSDNKFSAAENECVNVTEYRFEYAVLDNFSPINEQQLWDGPGELSCLMMIYMNYPS